MDGKTTLPIELWKKQRAELIAEKKTLTAEYKSLKGEVDRASKISTKVQDILHMERQRGQIVRSQGVEL
jgi:tRNA U34 2-thiouridine synthase MnmA/TrmU